LKAIVSPNNLFQNQRIKLSKKKEKTVPPLFFERDIQNLLRQFVLNFLIRCRVEKYFLKAIVSPNNLFQNQRIKLSKKKEKTVPPPFF
jgi:hypothetical protein